MTFMDWLIQLAEEHVRVFQTLAAIVAILYTCSLILVGRFFAFLEMRRLIHAYKKLENKGVIVFEGHELCADPDNPDRGDIRLKVTSWGGKHTLTELLHNTILEKMVTKNAEKREGFLRVEEPGQKLLMIALEEALTGNDPKTNMERLKGVRRDKNNVIVCPVTWPGTREAHLIRVIVIDIEWIKRLKDPKVIKRIKAYDPRHERRAEWLHQIATQWDTEQEKAWESRGIGPIRV